MTDITSEVEISRYFDAAPELVYRAFTDPEQLAQWFAPLALHVPLDTVDVDVRPGGHWRMTMVSHLTPGWKWPVNATFSEVVENKLLVGYEIADGFPGMEDGTKVSLSIEFHPEGTGTRLELRQGPFPREGMETSKTGWNQSFAKLDGLLATPAKFRDNRHDFPD